MSRPIPVRVNPMPLIDGGVPVAAVEYMNTPTPSTQSDTMISRYFIDKITNWYLFSIPAHPESVSLLVCHRIPERQLGDECDF